MPSTVQLVAGTPAHGEAIPELVWATGPPSYRYIFGDRVTFDRFVGRAWAMRDSFFGHTEATVALRAGAVVGVEIGFDGARHYRTKANLARVASELVADGTIGRTALEAILHRAELASYLNPFVPDSAYYVLALAVSPCARGTGVGAMLLANATARGRRAGCRQLHLDVLSDNPAVAFYRARGLHTVAETIAPEPCRRHGVPMEMRMATRIDDGAA